MTLPAKNVKSEVSPWVPALTVRKTYRRKSVVRKSPEQWVQLKLGAAVTHLLQARQKLEQVEMDVANGATIDEKYRESLKTIAIATIEIINKVKQMGEGIPWTKG